MLLSSRHLWSILDCTLSRCNGLFIYRKLQGYSQKLWCGTCNPCESVYLENNFRAIFRKYQFSGLFLWSKFALIFGKFGM